MPPCRPALLEGLRRELPPKYTIRGGWQRWAFLGGLLPPCLLGMAWPGLACRHMAWQAVGVNGTAHAMQSKAMQAMRGAAGHGTACHAMPCHAVNHDTPHALVASAFYLLLCMHACQA